MNDKVEERCWAAQEDPLQTHKIWFRMPGTVTLDCGHKLDARNEPKNNCLTCWSLYFKVHPGVLKAVDSALQTLGVRVVTARYGKAFMKNYRKFIEANPEL